MRLFSIIEGGLVELCLPLSLSMSSLVCGGGAGLLIIAALRGIFLEYEVRSITHELRTEGMRLSRRIRRSQLNTGSTAQLRETIRAEAHRISSSLSEVPQVTRIALPFPSFPVQLSREEVTQLVQNDAMERFGADGAALISSNLEIGSLQTLVSLRRGFVGERFKRALADRFQSFFDHSDRSAIGFVDHLMQDDRVIAMPLFGYRFSQSEVIGGEQPRVLWLGFTDKNRPTAESYREFQSYVSELTRALREYHESKSMQLRYSTEKAQSEERIKLLAYASHDMRQPINNLRALLRFMEISPEEDPHRQIAAGLRHCDMLSEIVDDALDYSRFKAGALIARREQVSIASIVEKALFSFEEAAREKGLEIQYEVSPTLIVTADGRQIARIVSNLISNAVKYTKRGRIYISARATKSDRISLLVSDTGVGMSESEVNEIFSPYKRFADQSIQGEGLGLALSKVFAELNDCTFHVDSARGSGTTVVLEVPGTEVVGLATDAQKSTEQGLNTVLIVDDHKESRESMKRTLEIYGFSVQSALSVSEAIGLLRYAQPRSIITDLSFPTEEGESLIRFILAQDIKTQVLVVSGRDLREGYPDLEKRRDIKVLKKPADISEVIEFLRAVDDSGERLQALCA